MNPSRFEAFSEAYVVAVLEVVVELGVCPTGQTPQDYALGASLAMLDLIQRGGIEAAKHYILNARGGAFYRTAKTLGVGSSPEALQHYLDGCAA